MTSTQVRARASRRAAALVAIEMTGAKLGLDPAVVDRQIDHVLGAYRRVDLAGYGDGDEVAAVDRALLALVVAAGKA